jgi:hypothetical protein
MLRRGLILGIGAGLLSLPAKAAFVTRPAGQNFRVFARGSSLSHTGDTNLTTLATIVIPGRTLGANGSIRVTMVWDYTNSGNVKTLSGTFGGTTFWQVAPTTTLTRRSQFGLANAGATNSQIGGPSGIDGFTTATTAQVTAAVDTTADQNLVLRCQLANSGETITLDTYIVELAGS